MSVFSERASFHRATCSVMLVLLFVTACGEAPAVSKLNAQQLLTKIEELCLDEGERSRRELARQFPCDAVCDAELVLVDSAACTCQRERLERDYSKEDLATVATLTDIDIRRRALQKENVAADSVLMFDLDQEQALAMKSIEVGRLSDLSLAYSSSKRICDESVSARSILKSQ